MKIDEFGNNQEVEEGLQDVSNAVIGKRATSAIKGMFTGNKDQRIQDEFVRDFLTTVGPRLKQSISTGLVRLPPATTSIADPDATSDAVPTDSNVTTSKNAPFGSYKPTGKERPPIKSKTVPSSKKPPAPASDPKRDAGGSTSYDDVAESVYGKYTKLNALFESIIEAGEPSETTNIPPNDAQSISAFLSSWFKKYMQGYDWMSYKPQFDALFKEVENTYRQSGGKAALTKLAKAAYSVTGATGGTAKSVPGDDTAKKQDKSSTDLGDSQAPMSASLVKSQLDMLKQTDPDGYAAIVNQIINDYKKTFATGTTESRRRPYPKL